MRATTTTRARVRQKTRVSKTKSLYVDAARFLSLVPQLFFLERARSRFARMRRRKVGEARGDRPLQKLARDRRRRPLS